MAVDRPYRFATVMVETYRIHRRRARDRSREHANKFADDWRSRFGNDERIWGDKAGGAAPPLAPKTMELREKRAEKLGVPVPTNMLDDWTLDHAIRPGEEGQIKDSIKVEKIADTERGWATDIRYEVSTTHSIFPINELGIGVPQRMTLEPARVEVASKFRNEAVDDFGAAIAEVAEKYGAKR